MSDVFEEEPEDYSESNGQQFFEEDENEIPDVSDENVIEPDDTIEVVSFDVEKKMDEDDLSVAARPGETILKKTDCRFGPLSPDYKLPQIINSGLMSEISFDTVTSFAWSGLIDNPLREQMPRIQRRLLQRQMLDDRTPWKELKGNWNAYVGKTQVNPFEKFVSIEDKPAKLFQLLFYKQHDERFKKYLVSALRAKWSDPKLRPILIETRQQKLVYVVETDDAVDLYMGMKRQPNGEYKGDNMLGEILMQLRHEFLEQDQAKQRQSFQQEIHQQYLVRELAQDIEKKLIDLYNSAQTNLNEFLLRDGRILSVSEVQKLPLEDMLTLFQIPKQRIQKLNHSVNVLPTLIDLLNLDARLPVIQKENFDRFVHSRQLRFQKYILDGVVDLYIEEKFPDEQKRERAVQEMKQSGHWSSFRSRLQDAIEKEIDKDGERKWSSAEIQALDNKKSKWKKFLIQLDTEAQRNLPSIPAVEVESSSSSSSSKRTQTQLYNEVDEEENQRLLKRYTPATPFVTVFDGSSYEVTKEEVLERLYDLFKELHRKYVDTLDNPKSPYLYYRFQAFIDEAVRQMADQIRAVNRKQLMDELDRLRPVVTQMVMNKLQEYQTIDVPASEMMDESSVDRFWADDASRSGLPQRVHLNPKSIIDLQHKTSADTEKILQLIGRNVHYNWLVDHEPTDPSMYTPLQSRIIQWASEHASENIQTESDVLTIKSELQQLIKDWAKNLRKTPTSPINVADFMRTEEWLQKQINKKVHNQRIDLEPILTMDKISLEDKKKKLMSLIHHNLILQFSPSQSVSVDPLLYFLIRRQNDMELLQKSIMNMDIVKWVQDQEMRMTAAMQMILAMNPSEREQAMKSLQLSPDFVLTQKRAQNLLNQLASQSEMSLVLRDPIRQQSMNVEELVMYFDDKSPFSWKHRHSFEAVFEPVVNYEVNTVDLSLFQKIEKKIQLKALIQAPAELKLPWHKSPVIVDRFYQGKPVQSLVVKYESPMQYVYAHLCLYNHDCVFYQKNENFAFHLQKKFEKFQSQHENLVVHVKQMNETARLIAHALSDSSRFEMIVPYLARMHTPSPSDASVSIVKQMAEMLGLFLKMQSNVFDTQHQLKVLRDTLKKPNLVDLEFKSRDFMIKKVVADRCRNALTEKLQLSVDGVPLMWILQQTGTNSLLYVNRDDEILGAMQKNQKYYGLNIVGEFLMKLRQSLQTQSFKPEDVALWEQTQFCQDVVVTFEKIIQTNFLEPSSMYNLVSMRKFEPYTPEIALSIVYSMIQQVERNQTKNLLTLWQKIAYPELLTTKLLEFFTDGQRMIKLYIDDPATNKTKLLSFLKTFRDELMAIAKDVSMKGEEFVSFKMDWSKHVRSFLSGKTNELIYMIQQFQLLVTGEGNELKLSNAEFVVNSLYSKCSRLDTGRVPNIPTDWYAEAQAFAKSKGIILNMSVLKVIWLYIYRYGTVYSNEFLSRQLSDLAIQKATQTIDRLNQKYKDQMFVVWKANSTPKNALDKLLFFPVTTGTDKKVLTPKLQEMVDIVEDQMVSKLSWTQYARDHKTLVLYKNDWFKDPALKGDWPFNEFSPSEKYKNDTNINHTEVSEDAKNWLEASNSRTLLTLYLDQLRAIQWMEPVATTTKSMMFVLSQIQTYQGREFVFTKKVCDFLFRLLSVDQQLPETLQAPSIVCAALVTCVDSIDGQPRERAPSVLDMYSLYGNQTKWQDLSEAERMVQMSTLGDDMLEAYRSTYGSVPVSPEVCNAIWSNIVHVSASEENQRRVFYFLGLTPETKYQKKLRSLIPATQVTGTVQRKRPTRHNTADNEVISRQEILYKQGDDAFDEWGADEDEHVNIADNDDQLEDEMNGDYGEEEVEQEMSENEDADDMGQGVQDADDME